MTHEELLAKIRVFLVSTELQSIDEDFLGIKMLRSLYTVVELHKPFNGFPNKDKLFCSVCEEGNPPDSYPYPCPTIQAIEKELG